MNDVLAGRISPLVPTVRRAEIDAENGLWQVTGVQGPRRQMWMTKGQGIVDEKKPLLRYLGARERQRQFRDPGRLAGVN